MKTRGIKKLLGILFICFAFIIPCILPVRAEENVIEYDINEPVCDDILLTEPTDESSTGIQSEPPVGMVITITPRPTVPLPGYEVNDGGKDDDYVEVEIPDDGVSVTPKPGRVTPIITRVTPTVPLQGNENNYDGSDDDYVEVEIPDNGVSVTPKPRRITVTSSPAPYSVTPRIPQRPLLRCSMSTKYKVYEYTGNCRQPAVTLKYGSITLVKGKDYRLTYRNNVKAGTATILATGLGVYSGTKSCTFKIVDMVPVYRLFNTRTGEHFYTASTSEKQSYLRAGNWNAEGIAWYAPKTSKEPIYRLSNPNNGNEHHYTKSKKEKDWLVGLGWHYDCVAWYSDTDRTVPIYRHYHPIQRTGNHHYTTSKGESDHIVKYEGWNYEGISFYVSKAGG